MTKPQTSPQNISGAPNSKMIPTILIKRLSLGLGCSKYGHFLHGAPFFLQFAICISVYPKKEPYGVFSSERKSHALGQIGVAQFGTWSPMHGRPVFMVPIMNHEGQGYAFGPIGVMRLCCMVSHGLRSRATRARRVRGLHSPIMSGSLSGAEWVSLGSGRVSRGLGSWSP